MQSAIREIWECLKKEKLKNVFELIDMLNGWHPQSGIQIPDMNDQKFHKNRIRMNGF